jgi:hypothetical protein
MLVLQAGRYASRSQSQAFPTITADALMALLPTSLEMSNGAWIRRVRAWAHSLSGPDARHEPEDEANGVQPGHG